MTDATRVWHLRAHGLLIESVLPVAEWQEVPPGTPDVVVRRARLSRLPPPTEAGHLESCAASNPMEVTDRLSELPPPPSLASSGRSRPGSPRESATDPSRVLLQLPNGGRLQVENGTTILVDSERPPEEVGPHLVGRGIGALLRQRGVLVLHASAVEFAGAALAVAGPRGCGKSTLAAAMCCRGGRALSDDVCAVSLEDGGGAVVEPGDRLLALRTLALSQVEGLGPVVGLRPDGRHLVQVPTCRRPSKLAAVVVLVWLKDDSTPALERARGTKLVKVLHSCLYRPRLAASPEIRAQDFQRLAGLARACPVFVLGRSITASVEATLGCLQDRIGFEIEEAADHIEPP